MLEFAKKLALKVSVILRDSFGKRHDFRIKDDETPVSEIDEQVNQLVLDSITQEFPNHGVLSEEGSTPDYQSKEYIWVCDPLDGTIPFLCGIPTFMFSLALVHNGEPIIGVVSDSMADRLYYASKGQKAYMNGERIEVLNSQTLRHVTLGFWPGAPYNILEFVAKADRQGISTGNFLSIVYDAMLVARGMFHSVVFPGVTVHDVAACKIILEEAGAVVTDLFGNDQRYDEPVKGMVAANPEIHKQVIELLKFSR